MDLEISANPVQGDSGCPVMPRPDTLAGASGIYLVTNERGGQHYVGSASGLLQRWSTIRARDMAATSC